MSEEGDDRRKKKGMNSGDTVGLPMLRDPLSSKKITEFEMDMYFNDSNMG